MLLYYSLLLKVFVLCCEVYSTAVIYSAIYAMFSVHRLLKIAKFGADT